MVENKPGYVIVQGRKLEDLARHVNEAIMNGYRPVGGILCVNEESRSYYGSYAQAMVLEGCHP